MTTVREQSEIPLVEIQGRSIPKILLGTSPFIAAGQFGFKAKEYYHRFVCNPKNIVKIICHTISLGVLGIQAIAYDFIIDSIKRAQKLTKADLSVVGTLPFEEPEAGIQRLGELEAEIILIHGVITDALNFNRIKELSLKIREKGAIPGVAIHKAIPTFPAILRSKVDVPVIMLPVNKRGIFMIEKEATLDLISRCGRFVIAKKTLAAGMIQPEEALNYVLTKKGISSVAIGIGSIYEANETIRIAKKILRQL